MSFGSFVHGFIFSIPAATIAYPLFDGKGIEDTFWFLFGLVAILGFPWNIGLSLIAIPAIALSMQTYLWAAFGCMVIAAHINGVLVAKKWVGSSEIPGAMSSSDAASVFRLLLIGVVAPAVAHFVIMMMNLPMLWFTAIDRYPRMVAATFLVLLPLHRIFVARPRSPFRQLPIVVLSGLTAGYVVLLCLLAWRMVVPDSFVSIVAAEYAGTGLLVALCCWALYNWGPVRVANVRHED